MRLTWQLAGPYGLFLAFGMLANLLVCSTVMAQRSENRSQGSRRDAPSPAQVQRIDELIAKSWEAASVRPSEPATDGQWCRRLYLDLLGRIPTVEELQAFVSDRSPDKRERLVERLLNEQPYADEFVENWTTIWSNWLIGRTGGNAATSLTDRQGMREYLRASFAENKPYDLLVYELITATGSTRPGEEDFNGAVNFLVDKVNEENASQATAATARLFLGTQVHCTQCHNHPFNDWKQQKYWEFNAFFRQTRAVAEGPPNEPPVSARLINRDYRGESGNPEEADLFFEQRNGLLKVAYPVFIDGTEISPVGYVSEVNRREELGRLIRQSSYLERAAVNRTWAHFLGYGFIRPVDDLGPHNSPTHPELLEYLAGEFRENKFDIKELIKWIVLSRPYALSSRPNPSNRSDDPLLGSPPRFSRFYLRQMRPEELFDSLSVATVGAPSGRSSTEYQQRKNQWVQQFVRALGTDEGDESVTFNGTVPQILMMFNGELIQEATRAGGENLITTLAGNQSLREADKIHYLFMAGVARRASANELQVARQLFAARQGNMAEALADLWWAILNSNEFIFNH